MISLVRSEFCPCARIKSPEYRSSWFLRKIHKQLPLRLSSFENSRPSVPFYRLLRWKKEITRCQISAFKVCHPRDSSLSTRQFSIRWTVCSSPSTWEVTAYSGVHRQFDACIHCPPSTWQVTIHPTVHHPHPLHKHCLITTSQYIVHFRVCQQLVQD